MIQILWSERAYAKYVAAVEEWKLLVRNNPHIGAIEPLLKGG